MFKKKSIAGTYFISSFIVLLLLFASLAYFWIYQEHKRFTTESRKLRSDFIESKRQFIKNEVDKVVDYITYKKSQTEERVKQQIKSRIYEAHALATHIHNLYKSNRSRKELQHLVKEALRPIRFNNGRGYYFATSLNGIEELFADKPGLEGKNLINMRDTKGKYVIKDMISIAKERKEGFYEYFWTKPMMQGRDFPKIAFIKHFEPFDWFIGTGEYLDDREKEIQAEVLDRISKIRFGQDGYIFITDFDGICITHINKKLIGKEQIGLTDPNGVKLIAELIKAAKMPDRGYVNYVWEKPSLGRDVSKLAYAKAFKDWGWVIGTGVYLDDIEIAITEKLDLYRAGVKKHITFIVALFAISIMITVLILRFFSTKIQNGIEAFATFFKKSAISNEKINPTNLPFSEFETLAHFSNKMVDDREHAEKILRERDATLRSIFAAAPIGIGLKLNETIKQVNDRVCDMVGYSHQELLEQSSKILFGSNEEYERVGRENISQIKKHGTGTVETQWKRKDGNMIDILLSSTPLNPEDLSAGITFSAMDITERKRAQEKKKNLEAQLQRAEKMESLGTLAGGVAHDLNNILGGLVSYPDLMLMDLPEDSPLREPITIIQKSGKKASAIVNDLLTLARRGAAVKEVANLNAIVAEYLESPELKKLKDYHSGILIQTSFETDLLNIECSPVHLSKTIMNLVSNAAEAVIDDGTITISTRNEYVDRPIKGYGQAKQGDYVILTVEDNGQGIPPEDLEKIFEPFYTKKHMGRSGTGLGMAVVWGTVKDHNGYIDVESKEGQWTKFSLYFPVTRKELAVNESAVSIAEYVGNGETVLVIDDVEEQRKIASGLLTKLGYFVDVVSSGEESVEYMKKNSANLIILDMIMDPGIDGLDTYKKILELHPKQKAIIASGFSETDRIKEAQKLGAGQYVKKPYTLENIGLAVKAELS